MAEYKLTHLEELVEEMGHPALTFAPDPYHPDSDEYVRKDARLRAAMASHAKHMNPKAVQAVKMYAKAVPISKIANTLGVTPPTVRNYVNSKAACELLQYIRHYAAHLEGPTIEHRKNILYRIIVDNEKSKPQVAMNAVDMLNKMDGSYVKEEEKSNVINIQINNELLPRTALDLVPEGVAVRET